MGNGGEATRTNAVEMLTKPVPSPSGVYLHGKPRSGDFDGMGLDGMGWDGVSNEFFNFLYTFLVFIYDITKLINIFKICQQHSYGFQNFISSWGNGI